MHGNYVTTNIVEHLIMFLFEKQGEKGSSNLLDKLWNTLNALSSKKPLKYTLYLSAIVVFIGIILVPPIIGILTKTGSIQKHFQRTCSHGRRFRRYS